MPTTGINITSVFLVKWATEAFFISKRGTKGAKLHDFYFFEHVSVLLGEPFRDVEIDVFRDFAVGMTEPSADHVQRNAGLRKQSNVRVPEGVRREPSADDTLGGFAEVFGINIVTDESAIRIREEQI